DNASNNDKMVEHLATLIDMFPGATNQTRCFTHILNLVTKSVLHQFEALKAKEGDVIDDTVKELAAVIDDLELDDEVSNVGDDSSGDGSDDNNSDDAVDDDEDGLPDEQEGMSEEELASLEASVKPIRDVLTKVKSIQTPLQRH
ncbi:hypothetical protein BDZ97DRAFT_1657792, partial [Flammula alnicola]